MKKTKVIISGILCMSMLLGCFGEKTFARETADNIVINELPGTTTVEKPYDTSFLDVTGYVSDGITDRTQYYEDYLRHNEEKKAQFVAEGGKESDYVYEDTVEYRVVSNEEEFCAAMSSDKVKVIEITNDLELGYKYLEKNKIYSSGVVEQISDYNKGMEPISSPDLMELGVSRLDINSRENLMIYSKNGSTIYHCEIGITKSKNIVIRNIGIQGMNEWDDISSDSKDVSAAGGHKRYDWDDISIWGSQDVWIDHCTLGIAYDGSIDITDASKVSVTWCEIGTPDEKILKEMKNTINYLEELYQTGQSHYFYTMLRDGGGTPEQIFNYSLLNDKVHAISCSAYYYDVNIYDKVTLAYNYYKNSCQRVPQIRMGNCNMFNCWVDATGYRKAYAALADTTIGTKTDDDGNVISPISYAASKGCSTLGLCRANSALGGATIGTDTCVFEGVIHPIISTEMHATNEYGYGAINHNLIVNSSTQDYGQQSAYIGSSWDNGGVNKFVGKDYWNGDKKSINNFYWALWDESLIEAGDTDDVYNKFFIGSKKLEYDYQIVPLDEVKETIDAYCGIKKVALSNMQWLSKNQKQNEELTVTFDYRTCTDENVTVTDLNDNGTVNMPKNVQREGYEFAGWFTKRINENDKYEEVEFDENTIVREDTYVYAKWIKKEYKVTYNLNGGTTKEATEYKLPYGTEFFSDILYNENVQKEGCILTGWYTDEKLTKKASFVKVNENISLYAKWEKKCILKFDVNDESDSKIISYDIPENTTVSISDLLKNKDLTKNGYDIEGWYSNENLTDKVSEEFVITSDMTLYAKWLPVYNVSYVLNRGTTGLATKYTCLEGKLFDTGVLNADNVFKRGYVFDGWYFDSKLNNKAEGEINVEKNITLYAKWKEITEDDTDDNPQETQNPQQTNSPQETQNPQQTNNPQETQNPQQTNNPSGNVADKKVLGDANNDAKVNLADAKLVLKLSLGIKCEADDSVCDVNFDGKVNINDARIVLKMALGILKADNS